MYPRPEQQILLEMYQMKRFIDMKQSPLPMFLLLSTWFAFSQLMNTPFITFVLWWKTFQFLFQEQWRGESEAAGGRSLINGAPSPPPASHTFLPLGLGHVSCCRHNMHWPLVIAQYIWVDGGATSPPSSSIVKSWWRPRGLATRKLQWICTLWYLNPSLLLPNNTWMVMHFFIYIAVQSHRKIPKVQNFQFSSFYQKKMCMFYSSSWTIFLKFKRQAN